MEISTLWHFRKKYSLRKSFFEPFKPISSLNLYWEKERANKSITNEGVCISPYTRYFSGRVQLFVTMQMTQWAVWPSNALFRRLDEKKFKIKRLPKTKETGQERTGHFPSLKHNTRPNAPPPPPPWMAVFAVCSREYILISDHYTFLEDCPPTPSLSQHFPLSEK